MKTLGSIGVLVVLLFLGTNLTAQIGGGGVATKENLDLPFDAFGTTEEEEEAPEVVVFYGQQFEGDGFFFCLDRSGSTCGNRIETEKREAIRSISQFSNRVQFAVVFYDRDIRKWPNSGRPAESNAAMKSAAISFIASLSCGSGTCVREGLLTALQYANRSTAQRNVVIYLGDGGTTCPNNDRNQYRMATLSAVAAANYKHHQINSICVSPGNATDEQFCQQLAASHRGTYKRIN